MTDPYVGKLTFFRVYSGTLSQDLMFLTLLRANASVLDVSFRCMPTTREEISQVYAGDIAAAVGLKDTTTGDTLCDEKNPVILESMQFPEPVIKLAIEPKTKADQEKMGTALAKLAEEDPTFRTETDQETGQTMIAGMGELHLDIIVDRMRREFKVEANVGNPQVAYKETIRTAAKVEGKFVRQSGGRGQYGHVWVEFSPLEPGSGFVFENKIVGGVVPREYVPAVQNGIEESLKNGMLAGFPVLDIKATLVDGSYHDVDSNEMAFKIAGSMALKAAKSKCNPVLLEPIMKVEVIVPEEYLGDVMGDINSRRGRIEGMDARGDAQVVRAMVPLSEMFGYATSLRSRTQGRGTYSNALRSLRRSSKVVTEEIVKKSQGE